MKKYITPLLAAVLFLSSSGCKDKISCNTSEKNFFSKNHINEKISEKPAYLKSPPPLNIIYKDISIPALEGTSSWHYLNDDGTFTGIESDSIHPLDAKKYMPCINLIHEKDSVTKDFSVFLEFDVLPDEVYAYAWDESLWGMYDAESKKVPVKALEIDCENGAYNTNFILDLKDGNYIYEVTAKWDSFDNFGGTSHYSFYTVKTDI